MGRWMVVVDRLLVQHSVVQRIILLDYREYVLRRSKGRDRLIQLNVSLVQVLLLDRRNISGLDGRWHQRICAWRRRLHRGQCVETGAIRWRRQRGQTVDRRKLREGAVERGRYRAGGDGNGLWQAGFRHQRRIVVRVELTLEGGQLGERLKAFGRLFGLHLPRARIVAVGL